MKKFRIVLLTAMCLIFGVLGLSGCLDIPDDTGDSSSTGTACVHELEKHDEIEATCSEEGNVQYWTCSKCGKFFTDAEAKNEVAETAVVTPKVAHTEAVIPGKAATCTETGLTDGKKCSVCGEILIKQTVIGTVPHTEAVIPGKAATCTETGLTDGKKCSVCGEILVKQTVIGASGHDYAETVTKKATCTENGEKTFKCSHCGDSYTETVEATGHHYTTVTTAPTCTEDGYTTHTCACGDTYTDNVVKASGHASTNWTYDSETKTGCILTVTEKATCDACGEELHRTHTEEKHNYVGTIEKAATCREKGVMSYVCSNCHAHGETKDIEIDKNAHNWGLSEDGKIATCSYCSETKTVQVSETNEATVDKEVNEIQMPDASVAMDDKVKESLKNVGDVTLSVEKKTAGDIAVDEETKKQIGNAPVYDFNMKAKTEGGEEGSKVSFDGSMTVTVPYTLSEGEDPENVGVYYITDKGTLEFIEAKYYEVNGKGYAMFTTTHFSYYTVVRMSAAEACVRYGHKEFKQTRPATCTTDGYTVTTCTRCGETIKKKEIIPALGHDYATKTVEATCTKDGYTIYDCSRCKDHYTDNYVPATGHNYTAKTVKSTCTEMGYTEFTCEHCGRMYKSDYTAPHGHHFKESKELSEPATCTKSGVKVEICEDCHAEKRTQIISKGHNYEEKVTAPTCTESGYTTHTCSTCGNSYVSDYVSPLGHHYEETVTAPTCTGSGYTTHTCLTCGNSYVSDYVSATGHRFGDNGVCEVCGHGCDHVFGEYVYNDDATCEKDGTQSATCSNCGYKVTKEAPGTKKEHNYVASVTKEPTCKEDGEKTYTCSLCGDSYTEAIEKLAHNFENGVCTNCGEKEKAEKGFFGNMFESMLSSKKVMIELKDFRLELHYQGNIYDCDLARLVLGVDDNGMLYGKGEGVLIFTSGKIVQQGTIRVVVKENVIYFESYLTADGVTENSGSGEISIEKLLSNMDSSTSSTNVTALVGMIASMPEAMKKANEVFGKIYESNAEVIEKYAAKTFDGLFTRTESENGYVFTLDFDKLLALNEKLYTAKVSKLIDEYFGEGSLKNAYDYIVGIADKKVSVVAAEITLYAATHGVKMTDVYSAIEGIIYNYTGLKVSIEDKIKEYGDYTVKELMAYLAGGNNGQTEEGEAAAEFDYTEYVKQAYDMMTQVTVYELIAQMTGRDAESLHQWLNVYLDELGKCIRLTITTDKTGKVGYIDFTLDKLTIGGGTKDDSDQSGTEEGNTESGNEDTDTSTVIGGKLVITPNGDFTADFEDLPERIQAVLKGIAFKAGTEFRGFSVVAGENGKIYFIQESGEIQTMELESPVEYNGKQYKGVLVGYMNYETISFATDDVYLSIFMPDCGDWYSVAYQMEAKRETRNGIFIRYIAEDGTVVAEEPYVYEGQENAKGKIAEGTIYYGFQFVYNAKTGEVDGESTHHNFVEDESRFVPAEKCEESEIHYFVCSICHKEHILYSHVGHHFETVVELREGAKTCNEGVIVKDVCTKCGKVSSSYIEYSHRPMHTRVEVNTGCGVIEIEFYNCACGQEKGIYVNDGDCSFKTSSRPLENGKEGSITTATCVKCGFTYTFTESYVSNGCLRTKTIVYEIAGETYEITKNYENHYRYSRSETKEDEQGRVIEEIRTSYCSECSKELERRVCRYSYEQSEVGQIVYERYDDYENNSWYELLYEYDENDPCLARQTLIDEKGETDQGKVSMHERETVYMLVDGAKSCEDGVIRKEICKRCGITMFEDGNVMHGHQIGRTTIAGGKEKDYELYYESCMVKGCSEAEKREVYNYGFIGRGATDENKKEYTVYTSPDNAYVFVLYEEIVRENCMETRRQTYYFNVNIENKTFESSLTVERDPQECHDFEYVSNSYNENDTRVEIQTDTCRECGFVRIYKNTYDHNHEQIGFELTENGVIIDVWRVEKEYDEEGRDIRSIRYENGVLTEEYRYIYQGDQRFATYELQVRDYETVERTYEYHFENCYGICTVKTTYKDGEEPTTEEYNVDAHVKRMEYVLDGKNCDEGVTVYEECVNCDHKVEVDHYYSHNSFPVESHKIKTHCSSNNTVELVRCVCGEHSGVNFNFTCKFELLQSEVIEKDGHIVTVYRCPVTDCGYTYSIEHYTVKNASNCTVTNYFVYRFGVNYDEKDLSTAIGDNCDLKLTVTSVEISHNIEIKIIEETERRYEYVYECQDCHKYIEKYISERDEFGRDSYYRYENLLTGYWYEHTDFVYESVCEGSYLYTDSDNNSYREEFAHHNRESAYINEPTCTEYGYCGDYCINCGKMLGEYTIEPGHRYEFNDEKKTYVCSRCGLENEQGVDQSFIFEDKGEIGRYIVSFYNKESVVGSGSYEIHFYLVNENGEYLIEKLDYELKRMGQCGKLYVMEGLVQDIASKMGIKNYMFRVSFLYNDWNGGDYLDESITLDAPGSVKPAECKHEWTVIEERNGCIVKITSTCKECGETKTEEKAEHSYDVKTNEDGSKTYTCSVCGDTYTEMGYTEPEKDTCVHEWNESIGADGTLTYTCDKCGKECAHDVFDWSYNEDGSVISKCKECGYLCEHKHIETLAENLFYCDDCKAKWSMKAEEQA